MPQGDKTKYTDKQKRQADHIEQAYEERGVAKKTAVRRAWATVIATSGGGKRSGSGRGRPKNPKRAAPGVRKSAARKTAGGLRASARRDAPTRRARRNPAKG
jgi:plasmid stabilization system protein ParE